MRRIRYAIFCMIALVCFCGSYMTIAGKEEIKQNTVIDQKAAAPLKRAESQKEEKEIATLYAKEALLMDGTSGRVLYQKDGYQRHAMASTTKIMTAIYVMEHCDLEGEAVVSQNAANQPKVHMGVRKGERYLVRDLLYALMLESYNDCAVVLAEHVGGSVEAFCKEMTKYAHDMGCVDTSFETPNGLDSENHYTTPYDLARITKYALENKEFSGIVKTKTYSFQEVQGQRQVTVYNKDAFLDQYMGAIGVKTGFTGNAGYCFVGAVKRDRKYFISVVLASGWPPNKTYKWKDTMALMDYGKENYENVPIIKDGTKIGMVHVEDGKEDAVVALIRGSSEALLSRKDQVSTKLRIKKKLEAPIKKGEQIGTLSVQINGTCYKKLKICTARAVEREPLSATIYRYYQRYIAGGMRHGT